MDNDSTTSSGRPSIGNMTTNDDAYLNLEQAANVLKMTTEQLLEVIRAGGIGATWVPTQRTHYLLRTDVAGYLDAHQ